MNKEPEKVEKFVVKLEDEWIEDVAALKKVEDEQYKEFGFPAGLMNQVKVNLFPPKEEKAESVVEEPEVAKPSTQALLG